MYCSNNSAPLYTIYYTALLRLLCSMLYCPADTTLHALYYILPCAAHYTILLC